MATAELPARLSLYKIIDSRLGRKYGLLLWFSVLAGCSICAMVRFTTLQIMGSVLLTVLKMMEI